MATFDQLNKENLKLQTENDGQKERLNAFLLQRGTQVLSANQKQELDDEIRSIRNTISENNQIIIEFGWCGEWIKDMVAG